MYAMKGQPRVAHLKDATVMNGYILDGVRPGRRWRSADT